MTEPARPAIATSAPRGFGMRAYNTTMPSMTTMSE